MSPALKRTRSSTTSAAPEVPVASSSKRARREAPAAAHVAVTPPPAQPKPAAKPRPKAKPAAKKAALPAVKLIHDDLHVIGLKETLALINTAASLSPQFNAVFTIKLATLSSILLGTGNFSDFSAFVEKCRWGLEAYADEMWDDVISRLERIVRGVSRDGRGRMYTKLASLNTLLDCLDAIDEELINDSTYGFEVWDDPDTYWHYLVDVLHRFRPAERRALEPELVARLDEHIRTIKGRKMYGPAGRDVGKRDLENAYIGDEGTTREQWLGGKRRLDPFKEDEDGDESD